MTQQVGQFELPASGNFLIIYDLTPWIALFAIVFSIRIIIRVILTLKAIKDNKENLDNVLIMRIKMLCFYKTVLSSALMALGVWIVYLLRS